MHKITDNTEQQLQSTVIYCKVQGRKKWEKGSHMQIVTIYQYHHKITQTFENFVNLWEKLGNSQMLH